MNGRGTAGLLSGVLLGAALGALCDYGLYFMIAVGSFFLCRPEGYSIPLALIGVPLLIAGLFVASRLRKQQLLCGFVAGGTIAVGGFLCVMKFGSLSCP